MVCCECGVWLRSRCSDRVPSLGRDWAHLDDTPRGARRASLVPRDSGKLSPVAHLHRVQRNSPRASVYDHISDALGLSMGIHRELKGKAPRGSIGGERANACWAGKFRRSSYVKLGSRKFRFFKSVIKLVRCECGARLRSRCSDRATGLGRDRAHLDDTPRNDPFITIKPADKGGE
ncbi:hypothetical protein NDU88_002659 [Pleurodeles waltl]|uniref:Uncharacterized protein n=1 Tax=Pleurodeles waltl TaxID=8319 RepID=A0AAV7SEU3_PLEWA|nr:hypothetical protein NDU88_002659 [Pleurodeles waltl]